MGYYDQAFGNIANEGARTAKTLVSAYVAGKHLANQKEANLNQAALNVTAAEHDVKLNELEQRVVDNEYGKALEKTEAINNQYNEEEANINKLSQEIADANKFANINKDMKNTAFDEALKSKSDKVVDKKLAEAAAYEKAEQSMKEKAINRGYDKDMAKAALENLEKDRTAALDMEQRIYDRLAILRENTNFSRESLEYAKEKYRKLGGK